MSRQSTLQALAANLAMLLALSACSSLKLPSLGFAAAPPTAADGTQSKVEPSTASVARMRATLLTLRSDPSLAARVPDELAVADAAVLKADRSQHDKVNGPHLLYIAERRAEYALTLAELRALEAEYDGLRKQRDALRGGR